MRFWRPLVKAANDKNVLMKYFRIKIYEIIARKFQTYMQMNGSYIKQYTKIKLIAQRKQQPPKYLPFMAGNRQTNECLIDVFPWISLKYLE